MPARRDFPSLAQTFQVVMPRGGGGMACTVLASSGVQPAGGQSVVNTHVMSDPGCAALGGYEAGPSFAPELLAGFSSSNAWIRCCSQTGIDSARRTRASRETVASRCSAIVRLGYWHKTEQWCRAAMREPVTRKSPGFQGFFYGPEWARTTTDREVHKALNLNQAV